MTLYMLHNLKSCVNPKPLLLMFILLIIKTCKWDTLRGKMKSGEMGSGVMYGAKVGQYGVQSGMKKDYLGKNLSRVKEIEKDMNIPVLISTSSLTLFGHGIFTVTIPMSTWIYILQRIVENIRETIICLGVPNSWHNRIRTDEPPQMR